MLLSKIWCFPIENKGRLRYKTSSIVDINNAMLLIVRPTKDFVRSESESSPRICAALPQSNLFCEKLVITSWRNCGPAAVSCLAMFWNLPTSGTQWGQANQIINFQRLFIWRIIFRGVNFHLSLFAQHGQQISSSPLSNCSTQFVPPQTLFLVPQANKGKSLKICITNPIFITNGS